MKKNLFNAMAITAFGTLAVVYAMLTGCQKITAPEPPLKPPPPYTAWIGPMPVSMPWANSPAIGSPIMQFGIRSDGVLVWRSWTNETMNEFLSNHPGMFKPTL